MSKYRTHLPQLRDELFMTDGGMETTLMFHDGVDLPYFAAFDLLKDPDGFARLRTYFDRYAAIARAHSLGIVLESPTWRASADWGAKLGYDAVALADANRKAIGLLLEVRDTWETAATPVVISGNLGPRGDGYRPDVRMGAAEAEAYHSAQIETFAQTDADMVAAFTLNYVEEAIGIAAAAKAADMPVALSFTLETDGRLPSGDSLERAIEATDAATGGYPAYSIARTPRISSACCRRAATGARGYAGCARTRRSTATPSSTKRPNSTLAIRTNWASSTGRCARYCRG